MEDVPETPRAPALDSQPAVHSLYEGLTSTWQYIVADPISLHAIILDPNLDNALSATSISTIAADRMLKVVRQHRYRVDHILHTHESTSHPSSAWYLRTQILQSTGVAPKVSLGRRMSSVQRVFKRKYSMNDGSPWKTEFESTLADGEVLRIGNVRVTVLDLSGGHLAFVAGWHIFAGALGLCTEVRMRLYGLLGDLGEFRVYGSRDAPPSKTARLVPVVEEEDEYRKGTRKSKLAVRYEEEVIGLAQ